MSIVFFYEKKTERMSKEGTSSKPKVERILEAELVAALWSALLLLWVDFAVVVEFVFLVVVDLVVVAVLVPLKVRTVVKILPPDVAEA